MITNSSRNQLTGVIVVVDIYGRQTRPAFVDIRQRVTETAPDDQFVTVTGEMTWPNIGVRYLRDPRAWWAPADLSGVVDPFSELTTGAALRAPSPERYYFKVLDSSTGDQ